MALTTAFRNYLASKLVGGAAPLFDNTNAYIGVGNGTTAFSAAHTDLQGASQLRRGMDATYPQATTNTMTFRATFGNADANWTWEEWGVFNASTGGTMMTRVVQNNGTKASSAVVIVTVTIALAV